MTPSKILNKSVFLKVHVLLLQELLPLVRSRTEDQSTAELLEQPDW